MFNQIKSFFTKFKRQPETSQAPAQTTPPGTSETARSGSATQRSAPAAKNAKTGAAPVHTAAQAPVAPTQAAAPVPIVPPTGETIALPLKTVLGRLPSALGALVKSNGAGDIILPLSIVLPQLQQGSVKISFGQLRAGAPAGTFLDVTSQDQTMIDLPLPEILSRINPALLARRPSQKTVEIPAEIGNVFGPHGERMVVAAPSSSATSAPAAPAAAPKPTVAPKPQAPAPSAPAIPKPAVASPSIPKPPTPAPKPTAAPSAPTIPAPKISMPAVPTPAAPKPAQAAPVPTAATAAGSHGSTQFFLNKDAAASGETLTIPLSSLSDGWPEAIKEEIKRNALNEASVALPMNQLDMGLRSGKIVFPWRQLGAWLKPTPLSASANGDVGVELPLKVIAPLFISQHRPVKSQKKLSIADNIPDVFSGGSGELAPATMAAPAASAPVAPAVPKPAALVPRPPAPAGTPSIPAPSIPAPKPGIPRPPGMPAPVSIPAAAAPKVPATMGELFGDATKKEWSPNEIVQKTSILQGMSGALMATDDGLLIASHLQAPLKGDTVAAFLPKIYGRMNQYGKELQVGDVSSVTVEFNKVPWHVVKLGTLYFAGIGKGGESLPMPLLKVITSELGKQQR